MWAADRLHPSELDHRRLAHVVGELLADEGLEFGLPSLTCTSEHPTLRETARTMAVEVAPWIGRRARDPAPWAAHQALTGAPRALVRYGLRAVRPGRQPCATDYESVAIGATDVVL